MYSNKISMEFIEGSEGIYRPIRVLFDTPIYARAMQICWHILSYRLHVAIMMELFRLQQKNQIPSTVTAEDMINLILEESKCSLREGLWEFEMEGFDDEEAKPLLKLAYAVNVSNKMRDVECEAMILLDSPEAVPPNFQHPRVISTAQDYARMLIAKEQETPKQLCPSEVVLEVVPRVLQAFLGLPDGPHLSMPSQQLSKMSVGVTKAVTDGVCSALTTEHQATFSRPVRDEMVLSVLTQIRQTWSPDVLVNKIDCLVPLLLSEIVQVAMGQICALFQPHGPKVLTVTTVTTPVQEDSDLTVTEQQPKPSPETDCAVLPPLPAGPLSTNDVQTREDLNEKPSPNKDLDPPAKEPAFGAVPPPLTPPAEPTAVGVQTREDVNPKYLLMYGNKISMEFIEGSEGIYRPIRVLFDTPIYARAMQICWHILSYRLHVAIMMELFRLQQKNQIPSKVTAEDMINLILEESKCSLREGLWEFEMEGFDDEEAKPLLKLAYAVNVSNKMRDIECEAMILLDSPEAVPPNFQHPRVISTAQDYARMLIAKLQEAPMSKQLCPSEVVLEVVPRVLQAFLGLPDGPHLSMPSQQLSKMSVGVTKAIMDGVCSALTTEHQATFSRNVRDEMVLSVLTQIRQTWSPDVLVNKIDCLVPLLLSEIVQVAVGQICALFQPHGPKVLTVTTVTTPVQEDSDLTVTEQQPKPSPETDCAVLPPLPAGPLSTTDVQTREDLNEKPSPNKDLEPPAKEPAFGAVPPPLTPPAEPTAVRVQTREDVNPKPSLEKDPAETTTEGDSDDVPVPPSPPSAKHQSKVQAREAVNVMLSPKTDPDTTGELGCAAVPTELPSFRIQANGDVVKRPCLEMDPSEPSTEADSAVLQCCLAPLNVTIEPLVIITTQNGLTASLAEKEQPNVSQETVPVVVSSPPTVTIVTTTPFQEDFNLTVTEQQPKPSPETECAVLPPPPAGPLPTTDVQTREDLNVKQSQNTDLDPPAKEPAFGAVPPPLTPPAEPTSVRIQTRDYVNPKASLEKDPEEPTTEGDSNVVPVPPSPPSAKHPSKVQAREAVNVMLSPKTDPYTTGEPGCAAVPTELPSFRIQANGDVVKRPCLEKEAAKPTTEAESAVVQGSLAPLNGTIEPLVIITTQNGLTASLAEKEQPNVSQETVPVVGSSPPAGQTSTTQPSSITDVQEEEDNDTIPKPSRGVVPASAAALNLPLEPVVIVKVYSEARKTKKRRSQRFFRWLFKPLLCCFRASDRD